MINLKKQNYEIHGHSEILGKLVPTAWGTFTSYSAALTHAEKHMPNTKFDIVPVSK